MKMLNFDLG